MSTILRLFQCNVETDSLFLESNNFCINSQISAKGCFNILIVPLSYTMSFPTVSMIFKLLHIIQSNILLDHFISYGHAMTNRIRSYGIICPIYNGFVAETKVVYISGLIYLALNNTLITRIYIEVHLTSTTINY